jgi:hypothetical protein
VGRTSFLGILLAQLLVASHAFADDAATAEALFREGRAAMSRNDYEEAARRFSESDRLQPAPGTRLNLASAESHTGRLAAAWEHARAARDELSPSDERFSVAQKLFDDLDRRVPRLTLRAQATLPKSCHILLDGTELREGSLGVALPQNLGTHEVLVTAPGHIEMRTQVTLHEGDRATLDARAGAAETPKPNVLRTDAAPVRSLSPLTPIGIATTVTGGLALAGGFVFGGLAIDRNAVVADPAHCDPRGCDDIGLAAARNGKTFTTVSTISIVSGLTLLATGITLWALAPSRAR